MVLITRTDELSLDNQVAQVSQHRFYRWSRRSRNPDAFQAPFVTGEVIHASNNLRIRVTGLQQLSGGKAVQGMLQTAPPTEYSLPAVRPISAGFVIQHLEFSGTDLIDAIDASGNPKRYAATQIDFYRLRSRQRLVIVVPQPPSE